MVGAGSGASSSAVWRSRCCAGPRSPSWSSAPAAPRSSLSRGPSRRGSRPVYKHALVPLDGSMVAEGIIPFVLEIAGPLDMEVVLLRVLVPIPPVVVEGSRYVEVEDVEKRRAEAEEYLAPIAAELRAKGVRTSTMV